MDAKEEIRSRLAIEDVIGEYVQLKRAGRSWKGLSPFGAEKTPSFVVSPDKQIWHDFSSGRGGDIFTFVQEMEGVDFKGALEILARRAGIDLAQYRQDSGDRSSGRQKERLYEANELAAKFYQANFAKSRVALDYVLKKRQFTKETALTWRLGYSPNTGAALVDFLKKKGFSESEIKLAGLSSQHYRGGMQDMFRGRLMIPLADTQGRIVGFTARQLTDDKNAPKYINTPSTPLYDKSRHVFGLHLAKDAVRKTNFAVVSEGNLDVIQSHQAGVRQVVATAGTALTEYHLKALSRLTGDIRLCFDADKAGVAATERAIPVAGKVGVNLQIITIPSGKDPDELIRQDVQKWLEIIDRPEEALDWLIHRYRDREDMTKTAGRKAFKGAVFGFISKIESQGEQSIYADKVAVALGYPNGDAVRDELKLYAKGEKTYRAVRHEFVLPSVDSLDQTRTEQHLIALALLQPKLRKYLYNLSFDMFETPEAKHVFEFLASHPDFDGTDMKLMTTIGKHGKILSLVYETLYQDVPLSELHPEAARLATRLISKYVRTQKQAIVAGLQDASNKKAEQLLKQARDLDELLRAAQEGIANDTEE